MEQMKLKNSYAKMVAMIGIITLMPIVIIPFYPQDAKYLWSFLLPGGGSLILAYILNYLVEEKHSNHWKTILNHNNQLVLFSWFYGFLLGALPFVISGFLPFIGAFFEAVSGFTTTGLSVMQVDKTPHIFLFHRSFMQFVGGVGFVLMMTMFVQEKNSSNLYSVEGHPDILTPNIKGTARLIMKMYVFYLILGVLGYMLFGMNLFESVCHSMCSLSTGGFSTRLGSIGEYNNPMIEIVTAFLMIIGTTNFATLLLFAKGRFKQAFNVSEMKFMFVVMAISLPLVVTNLCMQLNMDLFTAIRCYLVDGISAISTTGYSSMSYQNWPQFSVAVLTVLMIIGGGAGSTAGGMKLSRVYLAIKMAYYNFKSRLFSARTVECPEFIKAQGKEEITPALMHDNNSFLTLYLLIFVFGSLALTLSANCSIGEAMFEFASALSTVGLSIGITGPTTNNLTLIIEIIGMILGRLEIYAVFIGTFATFNNIKAHFRKRCS